MDFSRSRTLHLIVFLFLAAVSLRPWRIFEDLVERAFEPARALRHLATPFNWLSAREVRAAERAFLSGEEARRAACRAVLASAQSRAAPADLLLARGRGLVHAEVVDRVEDDPDRAVVRFAPGCEVRRGMPVVCGDHYVGRVVWVDPGATGEAHVDLVTRKDFRVGAEVETPIASPSQATGSAAPAASAAPSILVVGGVLPRGRRGQDLLLSVLSANRPSDPVLGPVRVREADPASGDPFRGLADGFLLGSLEFVGRAERASQRLLAVRPGLDYRSGLYQVAVVFPSQPAPAGGVVRGFARDPFVDECWLDAKIALAGDPAFWREGRILGGGRNLGIEDGAAITLGASLLGHVARAGKRTSSARLLGDAGLEISAIASTIPPSASADTIPPSAPADIIPIGRLVSLGRDRKDGALLLRWEAAVPIEGPIEGALEGGGRPVPVTLHTGSGQRAVPPGLLIGTTELPRGRGPFVLRVVQDATGLGLARVRVWRGPPRVPTAAPGSQGGP